MINQRLGRLRTEADEVSVLSRLHGSHSREVFYRGRVDGSLRLTFISENVAAVIGLTADELRSDPSALWRLISDEAQAAFRSIVERVEAEDARLTYELERPDGTRLWVEQTFHPSVEPDGRHVEGCIREVTAERMAIEDLRAASRELDDVRGKLVRTLSHRVRTPLAILRASAETAIDSPEGLSEVQRADLMRRVKRATEKLERLLRDLTDLPGGEGEVVVLPSVVRLSDLVDDVCRVTLDEHHELRLSIDPDLRVHLDAASFRRALEHLLDNVRRHTPSGTVVNVSARRQRHRIHLRVEDDGPGLPGEVRRHLFHPFVGGSTTRSADPSMGLGLALAQHLLQLNAVRIDLDQRADGTAFELLLPTGHPAEVLATSA